MIRWKDCRFILKPTLDSKASHQFYKITRSQVRRRRKIRLNNTFQAAIMLTLWLVFLAAACKSSGALLSAGQSASPETINLYPATKAAPLTALAQPVRADPTGDQQNDQLKRFHRTIEEEEEEDKQLKCTPLLNLPSYLSGTGSVAQQQQQPSTDPHASPLPANEYYAPQKPKFSFALKDISMPVSPTQGSLHSAIKLISSFDRQFDLGSSQEIEDEDGGLQLDEAEEQLDLNMVKFRQNHLQIEGLNLTMLNVHLFAGSEPKFGIGTTIKNTTLTGRFTYKGPVQLSGFYRMAIDNIYLVASSNLTKKHHTNKQIGAGNAPLPVLRTNDFKMNITNLGYISIDIYDSKDSQKPSTNYLLRMLQRLLQKTIKRTYYTFEGYIRDTLQVEGRKSLDCELTRFSHLLAKQPVNSADHQDDLSRILSSEILRSQLNHVQLPDFEHHQSFFGAGATIQLYNGSLSGLDHLRLNGETRLKLQDDYLSMNTSIGWLDLRPYYSWRLILGSSGSQSTSSSNTTDTSLATNNNNSQKSPTTKGFVAFNIKAVDFDAVISKGLRPHSGFVVDELNITRLDGLKMDIGGLPGMNRITRGMVNFFMGRLKQRLAASIQPVLKLQLEKSLNRISLMMHQGK